MSTFKVTQERRLWVRSEATGRLRTCDCCNGPILPGERCVLYSYGYWDALAMRKCTTCVVRTEVDEP